MSRLDCEIQVLVIVVHLSAAEALTATPFAHSTYNFSENHITHLEKPLNQEK